MTLAATNCNRVFAAKAQSLAVDFVSEVIDFRDMPMGSVQARWVGVTGALTGAFTVLASNFPEVDSFDLEGCRIDGAEWTLHAVAGSRLWLRDRLAFRYALVAYKANGTTGGSVDLIALGKKS
jgi:hypothetical protein